MSYEFSIIEGFFVFNFCFGKMWVMVFFGLEEQNKEGFLEVKFMDLGVEGRRRFVNMMLKKNFCKDRRKLGF